jgi:hypothetical protein
MSLKRSVVVALPLVGPQLAVRGDARDYHAFFILRFLYVASHSLSSHTVNQASSLNPVVRTFSLDRIAND